MLNSPGAMQLRTLQTIDGLGASPSNTVILMPVELTDLMRGIRVEGGHPLAGALPSAGRPALADQASAARVCKVCGHTLDMGVKFCNFCGAKVEP